MWEIIGGSEFCCKGKMVEVVDVRDVQKKDWQSFLGTEQGPHRDPATDASQIDKGKGI